MVDMAKAITVAVRKSNGNHHILGTFSQVGKAWEALVEFLEENEPLATLGYVISSQEYGVNDVVCGYSQLAGRLRNLETVDILSPEQEGRRRQVGRVFLYTINEARKLPTASGLVI